MFDEVVDGIVWEGRELSLSSGKYARMADGSACVTYGGTTVLCTVSLSKPSVFVEKKNSNYLALTVNFLYKCYATGKIPQGFFKREGKPTEREVLASRLIDRSFRPLIDSNFKDEISVVCTLISCDGSVAPEVPAMIGASMALKIAGVPLEQIVVGSHVAYHDGKHIVNPAMSVDSSKLEAFIGSANDLIVVVECAADSLQDKILQEGLFIGRNSSTPIMEFAEGFLEKVKFKKPVRAVSSEDKDKLKQALSSSESSMEKICRDNVSDVFARRSKMKQLYEEVCLDHAKKTGSDDFSAMFSVMQSIEKQVIRKIVSEDKVRLDGRAPGEIRKIEIELNVLPQAHGSALFTRGNTQVLVATTLGTYSDEQVVDDLAGDRRESFMLHYNFPSYSVGEVGSLRPPGRREIGHGRLAWKALSSVLPGKEKFPYVVRVVSDVTESDGSSSMATVCGSSLSLMDCGVPTRQHVAGIAMGLIKNNDECIVLTDISGDEDAIGDMDFKVAGTRTGITSMQLDVKIGGLDRETMSIVLSEARKAINSILDVMHDSIASPNEEVRDRAPCIVSYYIDNEKISKVIGTRGKMIKEICEVTGAKVDIEEDGRIYIVADKRERVEKAKHLIDQLVNDPKVGAVYTGVVVNTTDFGAFVRFSRDNEGLVHISEVSEERVDEISRYLNKDDKVKVVVIGVDKGGNVRLSIKRVNQDTGELIGGELPSEGLPKGGRGGGGSSAGGRRRSGGYGSPPPGGGGSNSFNRRQPGTGGGGFNKRSSEGGGYSSGRSDRSDRNDRNDRGGRPNSSDNNPPSRRRFF